MREEKEILYIKPTKMSKILAWHMQYLPFVTPFQTCNIDVHKAQGTYDLMFC